MMPNSQASSEWLRGQNVVVIGGSSGIGLGVGEAARLAGAGVTLVARNLEKLKSAAAQIDALYFAADITDTATLKREFERLGRIDHLIITAGKSNFLPIAMNDLDYLNALMAERIVGPVLAIKEAVPFVPTSGSIVVTGGQTSDRPMAIGAALHGSVAGIENIARCLALELAPIRVNAVSPGMIDTPLVAAQEYGEEFRSLLTKHVANLPINRMGTIDEITQSYMFLMRNGYVTGEIVHVDGGGRWN